MRKGLMKFIAVTIILTMFLASCGNEGNADGKEEEGAEAPSELVITDSLGRSVTITEKPERVCAIMASFADTWLLAGGELVATSSDAWDNLDLELDDAVVNLGSYRELNKELLLETDPDLVIASSNVPSHVELKDTLEAAGIDVLYFDVNGFPDYLSMLKTCTDITGRGDLYEENGLKVEEEIEEVKEKARLASEEKGRPSVLCLRASSTSVKAKGSDDTVLGIMLGDLYTENIADGSDLLEELSLEIIIEKDPGFIFIVQQGDDNVAVKKAIEESLTGNPAWAELTAVKEGRVHYMDSSLYHFKPNKRWGEAYEKLEEILYE